MSDHAADSEHTGHPWMIWVASLAALVAMTVALHTVRASIQQAPVALAYLLIVLAGSAYGGRALGLVLAVLGFVAIDYFFQSPFDRLSIDTPIDLFVLLAFVLTATIGASLLARAQTAAERARGRTREVERLSRLGAELLGRGTAGNAVAAIAEQVREATGADTCAVFRLVGEPADGKLTPLVMVGRDGAVDRAQSVRAVAEGQVVSLKGDGRLRSLYVPLQVHDRTVGVLAIASDRGLADDDSARRLLDALTYYAAIAAERVSLVTQVEEAEALRESIRVREALLASISHDLRTPLATIKVLAEDVIAGGDDAALAASNAKIIEEQADRLSGMVSNLLDVTRLRSGAFSVNVEANGAEDLIGAVARQVSGILGDHALERRVDESAGVLLGRFDFVQSQRILTNLIENAVRHSPPGKRISLHARREGEWLSFSVTDAGAGIPRQDRERIFEAFYRVPTVTADVGGVGLGLYIGRALAEAQDGTLTYEPAPSGGSTFVLRLPAIDSAEGDVEADV